LLHLQQISSKFSPSGCNPVRFEGNPNCEAPLKARRRCFRCYLQEIISERRSFSAEILDRQRPGDRKNSKKNNGCSPARAFFIGQNS
jgi:hypothetical protein